MHPNQELAWWPSYILSGQSTIIPKPEFFGDLKGDSLTKPPFGVTNRRRKKIWPDFMETMQLRLQTCRSMNVSRVNLAPSGCMTSNNKVPQDWMSVQPKSEGSNSMFNCRFSIHQDPPAYLGTHVFFYQTLFRVSILFHWVLFSHDFFFPHGDRPKTAKTWWKEIHCENNHLCVSLLNFQGVLISWIDCSKLIWNNVLTTPIYHSMSHPDWFRFRFRDIIA